MLASEGAGFARRPPQNAAALPGGCPAGRLPSVATAAAAARGFVTVYCSPRPPPQKYETFVSGVSSQRGTLPWTAPEIIRTPDKVRTVPLP